MKLGLTEKQYKDVISKILEQSESEPVSPEPEAGTSSAQTGGKGYPEVGKWESGVTRGPGNQVGITKWSDVVGSKLTRSKGNQLKEQEILDTQKDKYKEIPTATGTNLIVPIETKILSVYTADSSFEDSAGSWVNGPASNWFPKNAVVVRGWSGIFPKIINSVSRFQTPDGVIYSGNIYNIELNTAKSMDDVNKLTQKYNGRPDLKTWKITYVDKNGKGYNLANFTKEKVLSDPLPEESWWDKNKTQIAWIAGAICVGILTGGVGGLLVGLGVVGEGVAIGSIAITTEALFAYGGEALIWSIKGVKDWNEGKKLESATDFAFGFALPILHETYGALWGLSKYSQSEIKEVAREIIGKSETEILTWTKTTDPRSLEIFKKVISIAPKQMEEGLLNVFKDAGQSLTKMGKNPSTVLETFLFKVGGYANLPWYKRIPATLVHDLGFLSLIHEIASVAGLKDDIFIEKVIPTMSEAYANTPDADKPKFIEEQLNVLKKDKNNPDKFLQQMDSLKNKIVNTKKTIKDNGLSAEQKLNKLKSYK